MSVTTPHAKERDDQQPSSATTSSSATSHDERHHPADGELQEPRTKKACLAEFSQFHDETAAAEDDTAADDPKGGTDAELAAIQEQQESLNARKTAILDTIASITKFAEQLNELVVPAVEEMAASAARDAADAEHSAVSLSRAHLKLQKLSEILSKARRIDG